MAKILIVIGSAMVLYTILAKITGIPEMTDLLPVEWLSTSADGEAYQRIVDSGESSLLWLYTIVVGFLVAFLGGLLLFQKK